MGHALITTPAGEELVLVPRAEFEAMQRLKAASDHAAAVAGAQAGVLETLSPDEVREALSASTPLAFWRRKRGLTQAALAQMAGVSQPYIAGLERGARKGNPALFLRLARALTVRMEDLVVD